MSSYDKESDTQQARTKAYISNARTTNRSDKGVPRCRLRFARYYCKNLHSLGYKLVGPGSISGKPTKAPDARCLGVLDYVWCCVRLASDSPFPLAGKTEDVPIPVNEAIGSTLRGAVCDPAVTSRPEQREYPRNLTFWETDSDSEEYNPGIPSLVLEWHPLWFPGVNGGPEEVGETENGRIFIDWR
jgi:hypothetical protein